MNEREMKTPLNQSIDPTLSFGGVRYDPVRDIFIGADGEPLALRPQSEQVLRLFAANPDRVLTKDAIIEAIWPDTAVTDDSLVQCVADIRRVFGAAGRDAIKTVPRKGYMLNAMTGNRVLATSAEAKLTGRRLVISGVAAAFLMAGFYLLGSFGLSAWLSSGNQTASLDRSDSRPLTDQSHRRENLAVLVRMGGDGQSEIARRLVQTTVTSLSRYSTIEPRQSGHTDGPGGRTADYRLDLGFLDDDGRSVNAQLFHQATNALVVAENFTHAVTEASDETGREAALGSRIAALIGSPAGGAIGRHLLEISRDKPVGSLSRPECLAHGYGCTSCSGEISTITPRAVECLADLLEEDPRDPDAWALQSTIHARQYFWGSALQEPMRSDKSRREHVAERAVEAATRAETLADGLNPSVYWGTVQAYLASCDGDKVKVAVDRGLQINPDDPTMLAVYGNFLSYAGKWDEGRELIEKALEKEPQFFENWWYMALAKWHYRKGEYQEAYDFFLKSFDERNWLSHLQMVYTLPHLGRVEEAKHALDDFMRVAPSMTREHAYEFYQTYCFDDAFLTRMKEAFDLVGMPSRGSGDDFGNVRPVRATVEEIGGRQVEYVDVGQGIPVVFVHGSMSDYRSWGYMLLPMSESYRYLALTLRFFGTLDWPDGDPQFDRNLDVKDIVAFIEEKDLGPAYVVGWSRSGATLSALARRHPDLLRGIIIYEPVLYELLDGTRNPDPPAAEEGPDFSGVQAHLERHDEEGAVQEFFESALELNTGEFLTQPAMLQRIVLDNARTVPLNFSKPAPDQPVVDCDYIREITVPGLILYGEKTNTPWQYMAKRYADCLPESQIAEIENANHDGPLSRPRQVTDHIDMFIQRTESAR